jgi:serine/threonine-protein kinase
VPPPQVVSFGRYELLTRLARGGMAELFLARLRGIGGFAKLVAIKRILPHLSEDPPFVEMFLNEGRIAARLTHPNVCQVHELGEVDGQLFLVLEYLAGVEWAELVKVIPQRSRDTLRIAAGVIVQACAGLGYAHELTDPSGNPTPIVHRDVSPQNLFVTTDGTCKVLDFGVSKMVSDVNRTRSGLIKGKLPYMPPEQLRGEPVDVRADVFAMGVVLWEALTGERLFLRANDYLIFKAIAEEPIPPVSQFSRDYGPAVDRLVARALERDRELRHPTIRAFADELAMVTTTLGGPCRAVDLAELVKSSCAEQLEERSRIVTEATPVRHAADETKIEERPESATHSVQLRDRSIAMGRRRRRWILVVTALVAIGGGVAAAVAYGPARDELAAVPAPVPAPAPAPVPVAQVAPVVPDAGEAAVELDPPEPSAPLPVHHHVVQPPGFYSIDSRPYATIYIDGRRRDQTPLFRISLASGRHRVRAVLADGRERTFTIQIQPSKEVSSGTLSW